MRTFQDGVASLFKYIMKIVDGFSATFTCISRERDGCSSLWEEDLPNSKQVPWRWALVLFRRESSNVVGHI